MNWTKGMAVNAVANLREPVIVWFRDDLRLADHPALERACASGRPLICVYVSDPSAATPRPPGGAARWWLHHALADLDGQLQRLGGGLLLLHGPAAEVLEQLAVETRAAGVYWNRRYGQDERTLDAGIKQRFRDLGLQASSLPGGMLHEPWTLRPDGVPPYQVFSAYWRACLRLGAPAAPCPIPAGMQFADLRSLDQPFRRRLVELNLLPHSPDWAGGLRAAWTVGEAAAWQRLQQFVEEGLRGYAGARDFPGLPGSSRLSPYLRFGQLSPRQVWHAVWAAAAVHRLPNGDVEKFLSELGWRDFCQYLHYHHPGLERRNLQRGFERMPWRQDPSALQAWQQGRTGYPLVDAGMRELWQTGWMHNRVRMVAASFLVKHLLLDWREGEAWFWDTLVDADVASNPASWQWVAGCGMDAAPYFRVFNPVLQGQKFDERGDYVRHWVPELAGLPDRFLHQPWALPAAQARTAGFRIGSDYPSPVVEHAQGRERALQAFARMRELQSGDGSQPS